MRKGVYLLKPGDKLIMEDGSLWEVSSLQYLKDTTTVVIIFTNGFTVTLRQFEQVEVEPSNQ